MRFQPFHPFRQQKQTRMRLILAALFVIGSVFVALTFMMGIGLDKYHPLVMGLALSAFFFLSIIASYYLFNPYWVNPLGLTDPDEVMRRLKEDGCSQPRIFKPDAPSECKSMKTKGCIISWS